MTARLRLAPPQCKFAPARKPFSMTLAEAAKLNNVSLRSVKYARELRNTGREDICARVEAGELSLQAALRLAKPERYGPKPKGGLRALKKAWAVATPDEREAFLLSIGGRL